MAYYPVFLELKGKSCLVVGQGPEADRRAEGLAGSGAEVMRCTAAAGLPGAAQLEAVTLVFFCEPDDERLQDAVSRARGKGCLVTVSDRAEFSDFVMGAAATQGPITVAVSTAGQSPALARSLRDSIDRDLGAGGARAAEVMGRLRPLVAREVEPQAERARVYRSILDGGLVEMLRKGHEEEAVRLIEGVVGMTLDRGELGI